MLMGVILGFAALGLLSSAFGDGETETDDPVTEDGLRVEGSALGDLLEGGGGDDRFAGAAGDDLMIGEDGDDTLRGAAGDDDLHGDGGDDVLLGGTGDDLIVGGPGADRIEGGPGDDVILSAEILDQAAYHAGLQAATEAGQAALPLAPDTDSDDGDQVEAGDGDDTVTFGSDDHVSGGDGADLFETGDWVRPGAPATIADYDPANDVIAFSFDGPAPEITTTLAPDGSATVYADGKPFLIVADAGPGFSPAQIELRFR